MGIDITFNKTISLKDIEEKTSLKIRIETVILENENGQGIRCSIHDDCLSTLMSVRSEEVMDELVGAFNAKFITDNELQMCVSDDENQNEVETTENVWDKVTSKFGYIIDGDDVKVPIRDRTANADSDKNHLDSDLPF